MSPRIDAALCEDLARRAAAGDGSACRDLVEHLWPHWLHLVRVSPTMGSLARSDDHVHNVAANLVAKIGRPDGRGLRLYAPWRSTHPEKTFQDWIRIVTSNAVRDYVREQRGPRPREGEEASVKRLLNELATSPALERLGVRPPMTDAQTAKQLLEFAEEHLDEATFGALTRWVQGADFDEVAADLSLGSADDARRLVRAGVAVLRRRFAG